MNINPFNPFFPAPDHLFANRSREQDSFRQGLFSGLTARGAGPWNIALLGPWGIGKTSLLRRFARIAETENVDEKPVLTVTFSATGAYTSLNEFAHVFINKIANTLPKSRFTQELAKWELPSVKAVMLNVKRKDERPVEGTMETLYYNMLTFWRENIEKKHAGMGIFIDDIHNLLEVHPKALLAIRTLFQDLQGAGARFPLIVSGPETLFGAVRETSEPVTRFFEKMPVRPFSMEDTLEAISHPLASTGNPFSVEDKFVQKVYEKTMGHPFFIAFLMHDLVAAAYHDNVQLSAKLFESYWQYVINHLETEKFEEEWKACSIAERGILAALARQPDAPVTRTFGNQRSLLGRLMDKGLVYRRERGVYEIYHPLFAEFVRSLG